MACAHIDSMKNETQIAIRITHKMLAEIDELRRADPDLPSRAEVMRRAMARFIEAKRIIAKNAPRQHEVAE